MATVIKKSEIAKLFPRRDPQSHKGQNGRVLIIGGSIDYFGAPVLAGLGALNSGADLVYLLVPECNFEVSRSFYPDFIVRKYPGNFINSRTLDHIDELLEKIDALLIGPGISEEPESLRVITRIIQKAKCQVVLDAEAIPAVAQLGLPTHPENAHPLTITPHRGEMDELIEGPLPDDPDEEIKIKVAPSGRINDLAELRLGLVEEFSKRWGVTVLLKSPRDVIASPNQETRVNETGNAGMTVGGSGDVLAGCVTSLIAQRTSPYNACLCAAFLAGQAGDNLYKHKGYNFIATDIAMELPYTIKNIVG